jgi:hypothetical protein
MSIKCPKFRFNQSLEFTTEKNSKQSRNNNDKEKVKNKRSFL